MTTYTTQATQAYIHNILAAYVGRYDSELQSTGHGWIRHALPDRFSLIR